MLKAKFPEFQVLVNRISIIKDIRINIHNFCALLECLFCIWHFLRALTGLFIIIKPWELWVRGETSIWRKSIQLLHLLLFNVAWLSCLKWSIKSNVVIWRATTSFFFNEVPNKSLSIFYSSSFLLLFSFCISSQLNLFCAVLFFATPLIIQTPNSIHWLNDECWCVSARDDRQRSFHGVKRRRGADVCSSERL